MKAIQITSVGVLLLFFSILSSCGAVKTAVFDQYSYQKAIEIKVDASNLIEKSTGPYEQYSKEADELLIDVDQIVLYEQNKPKNGVSHKMWQLQADSEKNLLAGYIKRWKEEGTLSELFMNEAKPQIEEAMDVIILYENKKDKTSESKLMDIILSN